MIQTFALAAATGGKIGIKKGDSDICCYSAVRAPQDFLPLYAFVLPDFPKVGFAFAPASTPTQIKIPGRPYCSAIFPLGIEGGALPHTVALYDQLDHSWLSFPPLLEAEGSSNCRTVSANLSWEAVILEDAPADITPVWLRGVQTALGDLMRIKNPLVKIVDLLKRDLTKDLKCNVLNAMYPFMGVKDLELIATTLKTKKDFRNYFIDVFSEDFWINDALSGVMEWSDRIQGDNSYSRKSITCGTNYDHLDKLINNEEFSGLSEAVNTFYRLSMMPRKKSCVITTVRNEGPYILEWIAWYKNLGFDHIFIFGNNNDDGSDSLLKSLSDAGVITWIINEMGASVRPQAKICKYAFSVLPEILDFEWSLVLDIDEFLSLDGLQFSNMGDFFNCVERNNIDALGVNWKYVCPDRLIQYSPGLVTQKLRFFTDDEIIGAANSLIKSMSVSRKTISYTSHASVFPRKTGAIYRLVQGDIHRYAHNKAGYSDDPMWADHIHLGMARIIHYHFKSAEELLLRLYRGDAMFKFQASSLSTEMFRNDVVSSFLGQYGKSGEEIDHRLLISPDKLISYINGLLQIGGVSEAMAIINDNIRERIRIMKAFMAENLDALPESARTLYNMMQ